MRRIWSRPRTSQGLSAAALAPMVDLLTILLVALLRTWTSEPVLEPLEAGFVLPQSRQETTPNRQALQLDIGSNGIYVDGWRAGASEFWMNQDSALVTDVYDALQGRTGETAVIRAHRDVPWSLVGKVMFTVQQAGYSKIELVAVSRASL
ncbi:MAG: biopolymer transporter ExbD [Myxococcota bacterium]|nr:biopolymer transporter ExbD [Myxococcota bacterium]